jgi:hypothetical protein
MVEMKFICDRMLGKLATWLRISGYDTLYIGDVVGEKVQDEDNYMLENLHDRILLTKDRELYRKAKKSGRKAFYISSNDVAEQLKEVKKLGVVFQPVMDRCSVCNTPLRKPSNEEAVKVMKREGISEDLTERYELWYCEKCRKLYWMGGHWRNMVRFLRKIEE